MTSIAGWQLYFDGAANQSGFGISILLISLQGDHIPILVRFAFFDHHRLMNNRCYEQVKALDDMCYYES